MNDKTASIDALAEAILDPVSFARVVLRHDTWGTPEKILRAVKEHDQVVVKACHSSSKALALDTPIPTPSGWTTMGEVEVGDLVYNEEGQPVLVVEVSDIQEQEAFRVTFCTGESIVASADHRWSVIDLRHRPRTWGADNKNRHRPVVNGDWRERWDAAVTVTTAEMALDLKARHQFRWRVPTARPVHGAEPWPLAMPPYVFGAWLGDGGTKTADLTIGEEDLTHFVEATGGKVVRPKDRTPRIALSDHPYLDAPSRQTGGRKRIPAECLRSSYDDRLALMRGLMDTDGWVSQGSGACISQVKEDLARDIQALAVSLGWKVSWREQRAVLNGKDCGPCYVVSFSADVCPFLLPRKADKWKPRGKNASRFTQRTIVSIEPVGRRRCRCIAVDSPRRLYLAGEAMIPTHNTWTAAECVLWWLLQGEDHLAITTAPTDKQVRRLMWGEIKKAAARSLWPFPPPLQMELRLSDDNYAVGFATDQGVNFQGYHGNILVVVDEAVGVSGDIFEAIEGIRAGGNVRMLLLGNPTIPGGYFYDAFSLPNFKKFTIDAYDTPNMEAFPGATADEKEAWVLSLPEAWDELPPDLRTFLSENPRPYLAKRRWVWEKAHNWGTVSPAYEGRVRGRFPQQDTYSVFPAAWVEAAQNRTTVRGLPIEAGIDVAGPGDAETVLAIRAGMKVLETWGYRDPDPLDKVVSRLFPYKNHGLVVKVDAVGIGYHFGMALKRLGFTVRFVQASGHPTPGRMKGEDLDNRDRFRDLKAQYYWHFRLLLKDGLVSDLTDDLAASQMRALKYFEVNNQIVIEKKEDARRRGVKSPDRAEALVLAFAEDRLGGFRVF